MLSTLATIAICTTCICAIGAAWDAARRYIEMRRFNQGLIDEQARIDQEHKVLVQKVQALSDKLSASAITNVARINRGDIGGRS
jgi:hypothetical protein